MEPQPSSHRHLFVWLLALLAFLLFVGETGPERVQGIAIPTQIISNLEPAVIPPQLENGIEINTPVQPFHITTPNPVHGIYITAYTAGSPKRLQTILNLFDNSILNTVVIDIKDASGKLSYQPLDGELLATGIGTKRISDLRAVINEFHTRGVYVVGRLTVFEDPFYSTIHPEDTFTDITTGGVWKDYKGIAWLRPDSVAVREHAEAIARDAYAQGFDEINFDYVRFPSDGDLKAIDLSHLTKNKAETMQDFFQGLATDLGRDGITISADVFGLTMSAADDVGIGQKAVLIAPSVDTLAPMVYPSHFWNGTYGIPVPAKEPYKVIYKSLSDGIAKLATVGIDKSKLRPWLQDFDLLGVPYGPNEVSAQIQAAHDLGIDSWMFWDAANNYTPSVFKLDTTPVVVVQ